MRQFIQTTGMLLFILVFLFSCAGNPETKESKAKSTKALTLEQKTRNTLENTIIVFSGSMLIASNSLFKSQAQAFSEAFASEMDEKSITTLDEQITGLGEQTMTSLNEMMVDMDAAFDKLAEENLSVYEKIFLHDVMKKGVAITEKYDLPAGFKPLSQNLTQDELKRYIIKVSVDGQDSEDPIVKTYIELFGWFQEVGEAFNSDSDFQAFIQNLR